MNLNKLLSTCLWNLYTSSKDCLSVRENTRRKPSPDLGDEVEMEERGDDGGDNGGVDGVYGYEDEERFIALPHILLPHG